MEVGGFDTTRRGWGGRAFAVGGVTDVVRELTGTPAESFETTARRHAAMPFARPTFANQPEAIANTALTPFHPGYDLDRWERQQGFPTPPRPSPSIDDDRWRAERGVRAVQDVSSGHSPAPPSMVGARAGQARRTASA